MIDVLKTSSLFYSRMCMPSKFWKFCTHILEILFNQQNTGVHFYLQNLVSVSFQIIPRWGVFFFLLFFCWLHFSYCWWKTLPSDAVISSDAWPNHPQQLTAPSRFYFEIRHAKWSSDVSNVTRAVFVSRAVRPCCFPSSLLLCFSTSLPILFFPFLFPCIGFSFPLVWFIHCKPHFSLLLAALEFMFFIWSLDVQYVSEVELTLI